MLDLKTLDVLALLGLLLLVLVLVGLLVAIGYALAVVFGPYILFVLALAIGAGSVYFVLLDPED